MEQVEVLDHLVKLLVHLVQQDLVEAVVHLVLMEMMEQVDQVVLMVQVDLQVAQDRQVLMVLMELCPSTIHFLLQQQQEILDLDFLD